MTRSKMLLDLAKHQERLTNIRDTQLAKIKENRKTTIKLNGRKYYRSFYKQRKRHYNEMIKALRIRTKKIKSFKEDGVLAV